tara:strand:+ start:1189 stop:1497 length:309 start_codon:yes stop_codon:yes gene_type:complete
LLEAVVTLRLNHSLCEGAQSSEFDEQLGSSLLELAGSEPFLGHITLAWSMRHQRKRVDSRFCQKIGQFQFRESKRSQIAPLSQLVMKLSRIVKQLPDFPCIR